MLQSTSWWVSGLFSTADARVLGGEPAEGLGQLVLVGLARARRSRPAAAARASTTAAARAGSSIDGEGVAGLGPGELADRAQVAGDDRPRRARAAGRTGRPASRPSRPRRGPRGRSSAPKNDVKWPDTCTGCVGGERAGEDPDQADPADVRVAGGLHDLGHERAVGVAARSRSAAAPAGVKTSGEGCSSGDGKPSTARSSSSAQPTPVTEQTGTTGWKRRAGDGLLEVLGEHVVGDLLAAEVAVHQGLVLGLLDDPLDQGAAQVLVVAPSPARAAIRSTSPVTSAPVADRDVERQHLVAERRLRLRRARRRSRRGPGRAW